jgi:cleavage and polyadenylation specificity factor subunit 1
VCSLRHLCLESSAVPSGSKSSTPSTSCRTLAPKQQRRVAQRFVWPGMQKDCRIWARTCQACQRSKVSLHTTIPVRDFALPAARFLHVHTDLVGPLPTSIGCTYCLTAVNRFSHWPEDIPIPDGTADTVARALLTAWISRFGCPQTVTTEQGRQFESQPFPSLARLCGMQLSQTTAHYPAANGLVERFHQSLKAAIMCHADRQWQRRFPWFCSVSPQHSKRTCRR